MEILKNLFSLFLFFVWLMACAGFPPLIIITFIVAFAWNIEKADNEAKKAKYENEILKDELARKEKKSN